ncbi:MAG: sodium:calcium antiporter [Candidatus Diapherotrites archaeon]
MMILNLVLFLLSLAILLKCANYAIKYSSRIARILSMPEFIISFFIVALISILPEATISIISAFNGEPELGLGTILGSNIADLTLVLGIITLFASKEIKVKSKILKNNFLYVILLFFPILLGFDGTFSRIDGLILILLGGVFFARIYTENTKSYSVYKKDNSEKESLLKILTFLILSLGILLASAFYTVKFAVNFAQDIKIPALLIGLTIIALGTCLPELAFAIKAVRKNHDDLALGDIIGTVIADATIILGLVAIISPFSYNPQNIYITGTAMFFFGVLVTVFMKTNKSLSKLEGLLLIFFYIIFILVEFFVTTMLGIH